MLRMVRMCQNQVTPKVHRHGGSSCALHQYDISGSATRKWYYHYQLYIFWYQCYEHVYHYERDSIKHSHWVHDHRRYYSCKQNNHYSLTSMNNRIAINDLIMFMLNTDTNV